MSDEKQVRVETMLHIAMGHLYMILAGEMPTDIKEFLDQAEKVLEETDESYK